MAIYTPGPAVSSISGSIGGQTFSRNRGGQYIRRRAIPSLVSSPAAVNIKALLAAYSQAWQGLTSAQRNAWLEYARQTPVLNALGNSITRSGAQAYIACNTRIALAAGTAISVPPIVNAPDALTAYTQTYDIGAGTFESTFTPTPIGATNFLWYRVAVVNSAGINYVTNLLRFVGVSAANQATGFDAQSIIESRWGSLTVGQTVHIRLHVFDRATGLLSPPRVASGTVVST